MSVVCLCRGSIVVMKQEERDQGGRKGLKGGLSRKKEGREEGRSNPQEPELRASSHCSEQLRGEGAMTGEGGWMGRENSTVHGLDMKPLSGWAGTSTACKPLVIPIKISSSLSITHQAKVLMKTNVAASRYVFKLLTRDLPHYVCTCIS